MFYNSFLTNYLIVQTGTLASGVSVEGKDGSLNAFYGIMKEVYVVLDVPSGYANTVELTVENTETSKISLCLMGAAIVSRSIIIHINIIPYIF